MRLVSLSTCPERLLDISFADPTLAHPKIGVRFVESRCHVTASYTTVTVYAQAQVCQEPDATTSASRPPARSPCPTRLYRRRDAAALARPGQPDVHDHFVREPEPPPQALEELLAGWTGIVKREFDANGEKLLDCGLWDGRHLQRSGSAVELIRERDHVDTSRRCCAVNRRRGPSAPPYDPGR